MSCRNGPGAGGSGRWNVRWDGGFSNLQGHDVTKILSDYFRDVLKNIDAIPEWPAGLPSLFDVKSSAIFLKAITAQIDTDWTPCESLFKDQNHFERWCASVLEFGQRLEYCSQEAVVGYLKLVELTLENGTRAGWVEKSNHYPELLKESFDCYSCLIFPDLSETKKEPEMLGQFKPVGQDPNRQKRVDIARKLYQLSDKSDDPLLKLGDLVRLLEALKDNGDRREVYRCREYLTQLLDGLSDVSRALSDGPGGDEVERRLALITQKSVNAKIFSIKIDSWLMDSVAPTSLAGRAFRDAAQATYDGHLHLALKFLDKAYNEIVFVDEAKIQLSQLSDAPFAALVLIRMAMYINQLGQAEGYPRPLLLLDKAEYFLVQAKLAGGAVWLNLVYQRQTINDSDSQ